MLPDAFDPDDWADMTSMIDVPIYVVKGRGQYAGEGGRWTTFLTEMFKKAAQNPEVRKLAKAAAGKAVKKAVPRLANARAQVSSRARQLTLQRAKQTKRWKSTSAPASACATVARVRRVFG